MRERGFDHSLWPRILSSVLLISLLWVTVHWSKKLWPLCFLVCETVVFLGLRELMGLLREKKVRVFELYTLMGGLVLTAAIFFSNYPRNLSGDFVLFSFYVWCVGLFCLVVSGSTTEGAIQSLFSNIGALIYVVFLFGFLIKINFIEGSGGHGFVLYTFGAVYAADIAAYAVGMLFGKRQLAPVLSPKKTIEGAVGALAGACLISLIMQPLLLPTVGIPHILVLGFLIGIVSQIGDLWESLLKRDAGVKDSGKTIPGMGGVLDLMDGLLFSAPLVYLYVKLILRI